MTDFSRYKINNVLFAEEGGRVSCTIGQCGICVTYPLPEIVFTPPVEILLMDLDGTTVKSEEFWIYLMLLTIRRISGDGNFFFSKEDIPHIAGFSTYEHLEYCIKKYGIDCTVSEANEIYHKIAESELSEILAGRGNPAAFRPREGLKEFLTEVKSCGIKIGLATSGLLYKAKPEIVSAFQTLGLKNPENFYDAIITGGFRKRGGYGTLGEMVVKPHPWIYLELAASFGKYDPSKVVVLEDSPAGVLSARLAGFPVIGFGDGNLKESGLDDLCITVVREFKDVQKCIL